MTPAPSVAIVVSFFAFCKSNISPLVRRWPSCWQFSALQAFMSCCYLCSSNIFAMINYVGFATWVSLIIQYHLSFLPTQTNEDDFSSLSTQLSIGLAVFCLPYLRWKHPEWERPIKVGSWSCLIWRLIGHVHLFQVNLIFPIIYVLCSIFVTLVPMIASPVETGLVVVRFVSPVTLNSFRHWLCQHLHWSPCLLYHRLRWLCQEARVCQEVPRWGRFGKNRRAFSSLFLWCALSLFFQPVCCCWSL